ncbi:hypothetical protein D3C86_366370 [compost metagenome]
MQKKIILIVFTLALFACNKKKDSPTKNNETLSDKEIIQTAKEAYEFAYPMILFNSTQRAMTNTETVVTNSGSMRAPVNQLVSASHFPDAKDHTVIRMNVDTYYTSSWMNLEKEPLVLQIPNTNGRYYLMPMLDAWSNVFFCPGKRNTGTEAQTYLISGPKWKGDVPAGLQQVKAPTNMIVLLGRTQVNSKEDGESTVRKIQQGYKITPLSSYGKAYSAPKGTIDPTVPHKAPGDAVIEMSTVDFFNTFNKLLIVNPPLSNDSAIMKRLAVIGIAPGGKFDISKFSQAVQDSIIAIPNWAKTEMAKTGFGSSKPINGWTLEHGLGDYGTNYKFRAGVAYTGWGANLDKDAMYPSSSIDADGDSYDGSKYKYVLHFNKGQTPPSNAFWSLTLYDSTGFFYDNALNRYSIGDRNPLKINKDGSVDIYIQNETPAKEKINNWLPAPKAPFNFMLRVYWPKEEMTNGKWNVPAVKKQ